MKAVIHSRYGNPEVLQVTTLERPVPQKNEVLIRVMAAGLDYGQWHLMSGKPYAMRLATGLTKPKQRVLGMDVSAVVAFGLARLSRAQRLLDVMQREYARRRPPSTTAAERSASWQSR